VRIKIALMAVIFLNLLLITTCDLLPPQCALKFSQEPPFPPDNWDVIQHELTIHYTMENIGSIDLQNCKLYFEIDTDQGYIYRWTPGVDLSTTDPKYSDSYVYTLSAVTDVNEVSIIADGWDNPPDN